MYGRFFLVTFSNWSVIYLQSPVLKTFFIVLVMFQKHILTCDHRSQEPNSLNIIKALRHLYSNQPSFWRGTSEIDNRTLDLQLWSYGFDRANTEEISCNSVSPENLCFGGILLYIFLMFVVIFKIGLRKDLRYIFINDFIQKFRCLKVPQVNLVQNPKKDYLNIENCVKDCRDLN